jgi:hypothetical protein
MLLHGHVPGDAVMDDYPFIISVMFACFAAVLLALAAGNLALILMRFSHADNMPPAQVIRSLARHLSFLRLGGKDQRDRA